jgi:hypothetical protein
MAWGIDHGSAANALILSLTIPVLMVLTAMIILKERPGRYLIWSLLLAMVGTALISWDDVAAGNFTVRMLVGNVAAFLSGAGAAYHNAYYKEMLARYSPAEVLVYGSSRDKFNDNPVVESHQPDQGWTPVPGQTWKPVHRQIEHAACDRFPSENGQAG